MGSTTWPQSKLWLARVLSTSLACVNYGIQDLARSKTWQATAPPVSLACVNCGIHDLATVQGLSSKSNARKPCACELRDPRLGHIQDLASNGTAHQSCMCEFVGSTTGPRSRVWIATSIVRKPCVCELRDPQLGQIQDLTSKSATHQSCMCEL